MNPTKVCFKSMYPTDSVSAAHGIHSYTAKLIPFIPRYLVQKYSCQNDIVLDPFCGSGTTLLEARLKSRNAVGIDINPLAVLISESKTKSPDLDELSLAIQSVLKDIVEGDGRLQVDFPNIDYWFSKEAQDELSRIKFCVEKSKDNFSCDVYKFLLVSFSSIIRKSSYADPRMAKTYKSKVVLRRINSGWKPTPIAYFQEAVTKNFDRIQELAEATDGKSSLVRVFHGDAKQTSSILKNNGVEEIDLVLTSPPYINAQDYFRSYKLELWWLGLATPEEVRHLNRQAVGTERIGGVDCDCSRKGDGKLLRSLLGKIGDIDKRKSRIVFNYFESLRSILNDFNNVLKQGGFLCLVTGNNTICGTNIPTYKILMREAEKRGFELVEMLNDEIRNRSLPPGRKHKGGIIREEWITVFQKTERWNGS